MNPAQLRTRRVARRLLLAYVVVLTVVTVWTAYLQQSLENSDGLYGLWQIVLSIPLGLLAFILGPPGIGNVLLVYLAGMVQAVCTWAAVHYFTARSASQAPQSLQLSE